MQAAIKEMADKAVAKFTDMPLYKQAVTEGWEPQLFRYASAVAVFQSFVRTRKSSTETLDGFDTDAVFGAGFAQRVDAGDAQAYYAMVQWQRQQMAECAHGIVTIRVPPEHVKRLVALAVAEQNAMAAHGSPL